VSFDKFIVVVLLVLAGCTTQTIEYRSRPMWHTALSGGLPIEYVREDGTIMKYSSSNETSSKALQAYLQTVVLEEKDEITGELTLRAILPEHVLTHVLTCLRDRNWDVLYEQLISSKMQQFYEQPDVGREQFDSFFISNRRELAKTLQRIRGGKGFGEVIASENENEIVYALSARVARNYKFKNVSFIRENQFLKLHSIW